MQLRSIIQSWGDAGVMWGGGCYVMDFQLQNELLRVCTMS